MAKRKRLTKKERERRNKGLLGLFVVMLIFLGGYVAGRRDITLAQIKDKLDEATTNIERQITDFELPSRDDVPVREKMSQIHILDVGQGSSILFISQEGTSILVDTGRFDDCEKRIISYLDSLIGLGGKIDLLIFSHNDADHIGHGDLVLDYYDVQLDWMNGVDSRSKV